MTNIFERVDILASTYLLKLRVSEANERREEEEASTELLQTKITLQTQ